MISVVIMLLWMEYILHYNVDTSWAGYGTENVVCVLMFANSLGEWTNKTEIQRDVHVQLLQHIASNSPAGANST